MAFSSRSGSELLTSDFQGFNRRWRAPNLEKVYLPESWEDTLAAMTEIISSGRYYPEQVQLTCGRHCYENFVYNNNTKAVIDLTGLRGSGWDKDNGFYVDAGNSNWDMYRTFHNNFGRTLPAGSCHSVGLGGHITGGGYGILSRMHGLAIDHLTGADVIIFKSGRPEKIYVQKRPNDPLFWAICGGGGGNFGIITRYYFQNPPKSPQYMYLSAITIPWDGVTKNMFYGYLSTFAEYECRNAPNNRFHILHVNHIQTGAIVLASYAFYDQQSGQNLATFEAELTQEIEDREKRYGRIGVPLSREPAPMIGHPWFGDSRAFMPTDTSLPYRRYDYLEGTLAVSGIGQSKQGKYKSTYMRNAIPRNQSDVLFERMQANETNADLTSTLFQIDSYGGKINDVPQDDTAVWQRSSIMKFQYQTYWMENSSDPAMNERLAAANIKWLRDTYQAVYAEFGGVPDPNKDPTNNVDGCYINYPDADLGVNNPTYMRTTDIDRALRLYYGKHYDAADRYFNLIKIKKIYNPNNWFRGPQSIPVNE
jgi:hypothetical protein